MSRSRFDIIITKIDYMFYFSEAMSYIFCITFKDADYVIKNTKFPINICDLCNKFSMFPGYKSVNKNNEKDFTEEEAEIIKYSIGSTADLEIKKLEPKITEYFLTSEEDFENKKDIASTLGVTIEDITKVIYFIK